uniref:Odorant-binding protein n=1 Tax=Phenacoccus solenopsis TaxID=483260 RepID=A0A0U2IRC1_9HEMI|nr:odorant-binding protein [Phenacoccus solenopsis]
MYFSVVFLFVLNTLIVQGTSTGSLSFYTDQEHQALQLCSQEYQTVLDTPYFVANARIPDESDHNMKCLFYCVPQKIGVTDDKGVINSVQIRDMLKTKYPSMSNTAVKILLKKCGKERKTMDKCDKWYEVSKCTWKLYLEYQEKIEAKRQKKTTSPRPSTTHRAHHHLKKENTPIPEIINH